MSSSARKPGGPTATLVAIPNKACCWESLDGPLDFLLLIHILGAKALWERSALIVGTKGSAVLTIGFFGLWEFRRENAPVLQVPNDLIATEILYFGFVGTK